MGQFVVVGSYFLVELVEVDFVIEECELVVELSHCLTV